MSFGIGKARMFQKNKVNIMTVDALAPCVTLSPAIVFNHVG